MKHLAVVDTVFGKVRRYRRVRADTEHFRVEHIRTGNIGKHHTKGDRQ